VRARHILTRVPDVRAAYLILGYLIVEGGV